MDDSDASESVRPREGETHTRTRTFTEADVRRFGDLSGDQQPIHTDPDEEGRLVVQGLLTATLQTQIGGAMELLARSMEFEFRRPVHTGEEITCEWTTETVEERGDRLDVEASFVCRNEADAVVLTGEVEGIVRTEAEET